MKCSLKTIFILNYFRSYISQFSKPDEKERFETPHGKILDVFDDLVETISTLSIFL